MNPVTYASIKRVDNGYLIHATDSERQTIATQVHAKLADALDAIEALGWAEEDTP